MGTAASTSLRPAWAAAPRGPLVRLSGSQVHDVDVGSQPHVVGQVPAGMVGIFIDDDVIAVPEPVAAEANVIRSDTEIEAAEPEAVGAASGEMPDVAAAEAAGKASVLPGMIEVVVGIVGTGVVADPFAVRMDVRRVGMSGLVVEVRSSPGTGCATGAGPWAGMFLTPPPTS